MTDVLRDRSWRCAECSGDIEWVDTGTKILITPHRCADWECTHCDAFVSRPGLCADCNEVQVEIEIANAACGPDGGDKAARHRLGAALTLWRSRHGGG